MPEEIVRVNEANQKSDRLEKQVATPADFTSPEVSGLEIADLLSENIILSPPVCLLCQCLSSWNSLCSKRQIRVCCRLVF